MDHATPAAVGRTKNIVISGTNFWNPGDDFVRDGVIRILHELFPGEVLNFLFYNFNPDFFPQSKFAGIGNTVAQGDLEKYREDIDLVVIAGLSAGQEIKDLYRWVVANQLADKVWLIGAGYENGYVEQHVAHEPEATIFRQARVVTGRTARTPEFFKSAGIPYHHINCPAILSVPEVKSIPAGQTIQRIGFSIQLPHGVGLTNQTCAPEQYELSVALLRELSRHYAVEVVAHHKTEYFHFLNLLRGENIPVIFSSFYQDLHPVYPRYDLVVTTRLHSSLFANGHGIPGIILNDTDRHTHTLDGFLHSTWVNTREKFDQAFSHWQNADLAAVALELDLFKANLLAQYLDALRPLTGAGAVSTPAAPIEPELTPEIAEPSGDLPVHFFTIVLNGEPFIRHHIEAFRQLPFEWHWHIVEGVAELNHDTGWSKAAGGRIPAALHRHGLSVDGTTEYLDALKRQYPENITIYRPPAGRFWDGKREMVNAPLPNLTRECLLWQVDADELWTQAQILRTRSLFLSHPEKTAAYFFCHYFVGPELLITSRDTYGNNSSYEWLRVWRYQPGDSWVAHEPPRLCRDELDIASLNSFRHAETEAFGLVFQHYAYALESQIAFKESYYGYAGAVAQWRQLQAARQFPQRLSDYFAWVKDGAVVNTLASAGLKRIVPDDWFAAPAAPAASPLDGAERILFVRTDSIGDAVLASAMLAPLHRRFPRAKIAVLCQHHVADLYVACPFVDSIICYDRKQMNEAAACAEILGEIAVFKPDVVLNSVRSRDAFSNELTLAIPGARHFAIAGDLDNITPAERTAAQSRYELLVPTPDAHQSELVRHAGFLRGLGIPAGPLQPVTWTAPADELLADEFFKLHGLDPFKTLAVFPGAQHAMRVYHGYGEALKQFTGFHFLIFGDASQTPLAEEIEKDLPGRTVNLCGRSSLRETIALVRRCRLYVGAESAGAHIACAVGVPNVVILGGGHFGRFMPYSPLTTAVSLPLNCFGCNWRCRFKREHCIKDIAPEMLADAIRQTLEKTSDRPRLFLQASVAWAGGRDLPDLKSPEAWLPDNAVEIIRYGNPASSAENPALSGKMEIVGEGIADPAVSVVISTFKSEKFMRACLDNLSLQTIFARCEVIVVDSGSPENERAIVLEFQQKFPNLRYVRTERETLYAAWNRGLALARGRYWANVNTDDSLRPDALEIMTAALDRHSDCALAYADCAWTTQPNDMLPSEHIVRTVKYPDYTPVENLFYCITGCLQFFRTETLRQLGGFDAGLKCVGDYEAVLKMMAARLNAVHVPEVLSLFYQNTDGLTLASNRSATEHEQVLNHYYKTLNIANLFKVNPQDRTEVSMALTALAAKNENIRIPWVEHPCSRVGFAMACYQAALDADPQNAAAAIRLCSLYHKTNQLPQVQAGLLKKWPHLKAVIDRVLAGENCPPPAVEPALVGPVYQPAQAVAAPEKVQPSSPAASPLPAKLSLLWQSPVFDPSGYADESRYLLGQLPSDLPVRLEPLGRISRQFFQGMDKAERARLEKLIAHSLAGDFIQFTNAPAYALRRDPRARYAIGRSTFETDRLPADWVAACNGMDEIWVPTEFNVETFQRAGVTVPIHIVPQGVDTERFHPGLTPLEIAGRRRFAFLSVFEWIHRKGWDVLLRAWAETFTADAEVCLLIRSYLPNATEGGASTAAINERIDQFLKSELGRTRASVAPIIVLGEQLAQLEMPRLYASADCFVLPSRGEGWGRPYIEAMACGLPVIGTRWGGQLAFMHDQNSLLLETEGLETVDARMEFKFYAGHQWARPSVSHLGQLLRRVVENPADAQMLGAAAAAEMREKWNWQKAGQIMQARLNAIRSGKPDAKNVTPIKVAWEGSFLDHGSLSHVNRELTGALKSVADIVVQPVSNGAPASPGFETLARDVAAVAPADAVITVRHAWPPRWSRPAHGKLAVIQPWEFGSLPQEWVNQARDVDEFWVPSRYVQNVYVGSGVPAEKVFVVPNGVDVQKFTPAAAPMKLPTQKKFKFLFVGGTIGRKGPDLLLQAYVRNFTAADDVCLVIKDFGGQSVYSGQTFESQIRKAQSLPGGPEIIYLNEELPPETLPGLYTACDCLVMPYRGEGFGLPALEAMACGLPLIVTAGGATDDFVTDAFAWRIPAERKVFGQTVSNQRLVHPGWMLEPSLPALGEKMRFAFEHPAEARERGQLACEHARQHWSWQHTAEVTARRIRELAASAVPVNTTPSTPAPAPAPRKLPAVAAIGRLDEAREFFAQKNLPAAWAAAAEAIAKRPFHPEAYLLLAEIALAAGAGKEAKTLAQRVREMAPGWSAAKQFLARPLKGNAKPNWLDTSSLQPRASRLSICLIAKNEEQFLAQCLKSVQGLDAQIILVDTGSKDRTVEIAREFGAEIHHFAWCEDFAAARNAALEPATGDWILVLDADEELPAAQHAKLLADMKNAHAIAYRMPMINAGKNDGRCYVPRLFRNAPGVHYFSRIHEQVFPSLLASSQAWGLKSPLGTAELVHHGYTKELVRDRNKIERNLNLLKLALAENPSDVNLVMNLGLELVRSGELSDGIEKYREAYRMMSAQPTNTIVPELREVLLTQFTSQLYKIRAHAEVLEILTSPLSKNGGLTASLHFALGLAQFELGSFNDAAGHMRQCLAKRKEPGLTPINTDILTVAPAHCLALSLANLGEGARAEKAFEAALAENGNLEPVKFDFARLYRNEKRPVDALKQLNDLVTQNPAYAAAWRMGGEITLENPDLREFAREWTEAALKALPADPILLAQRAEALMLNGDTASARELWEKIWRQDRAISALAALILCEALESSVTQLPQDEAQEREASRAFIAWYQKSINMGAQPLVLRLNEQLEKLSRALPTAAQMLSEALRGGAVEKLRS